ncbi:MAG: transporter [Alphaproteobacteria bacterium BRH_c36]|nr:MAG: transporter [Alphaproteobacteria bacterium BRH_c36]
MSCLTIAQIVVVMLLWAACFPALAIGIELAPHVTFATLRAGFAGLTLTAIAITLGQKLPVEAKLWIRLTIVGVGATTLGFLGMFHAAEFVSPGLATVIANAQPLLAAGLGAFVLNESLTAQSRAGLLVGFLGILVISSPQLVAGEQQNYILGIAYILLAAIGISVSNVMIKTLSGKLDALMAMGLQMLIGSIPLALVGALTEDPTDVTWSYDFLGILVFVSLPGTALAYWLWFSALEKTQLSHANAFSFLVPIFGLSMGWFLFDETLNAYQAWGIALTIMGVGLVLYSQDPTQTA